MTSKTFVDESGTWEVNGSVKLLVKPSPEFIARQELDEQKRLEDLANAPSSREEKLEQQVADLQAQINLLLG